MNDTDLEMMEAVATAERRSGCDHSDQAGIETDPNANLEVCESLGIVAVCIDCGAALDGSGVAL